jgi:hypothetical protein
MAQEEGYESWDSLNKKLWEQSAPLREEMREVVAKEQERRKSTPGVLQVWEYLRRMSKSKDPLHQAIAENIVYRDLYKMAKSFHEKSLNTPLLGLSDSIHQVAINTTSVIAGSGYDSLSVQELKHKAARFDAMRNGEIDFQNRQVYSTFDPPHYECIVQGTADKITKFINDFIQRDGRELQLKFASRGKGYFFDDLEKQPNGQYTIFVSKYDENEKRDPVGPVIQFEFVEATDRVKVRATCYYDDAVVIEYFNALRKKFVELFPALQDREQVQDVAALPKIEDPTDQRIWAIIKKDPSITDTAIAQKLGQLKRQQVNARRRTLEKMGYPVRVSRQK